jgi:asparagine synthase (glutamine-hydrolysing)
MTPAASGHALLVSFEGRIDNRDDLLREVSLPPESGDAAIVTACYRRFGVTFPAHVFGDFAFALWDGHRALLLLGSDCFGVYPLYYHRHGDEIAWSSHLEDLASRTGGRRDFDPLFVAGFLTTLGRQGDVTPFASIAGVPPASVVSFTRGRVSVDRYWRLDPENQIRWHSDAEYEEQCLELFRGAVRDRLRSDGPVFCELSGGLDSSSIVGVADRIIGRGPSADERLQTISHIYEESGTFDDRPYIRVMEEAFGRRAHHVEEENARLLASIDDDYSFAEPSPFWVGAKLVEEVKAQLSAAGSNVLLNGMGGDHLFWSEFANPPDVADDLSRLRFRSAFRESKRWAAALGKPQSAILIAAARDVFGRTRTTLPPWIDRRFARATGIDQPLREDAEAAAFRLPSQRAHFIALRSLAGEVGSHRSIYAPIDVRYPFLDRRLVEFALAIPHRQHVRVEESRSLQRRAIAQIVPHEIAGRRTKGGPTGTVYRRFRQRWPAIKALFEDARVCAYGYVDRAALTDSLQRAAHGQNQSAPGLLRLIALESWLRKTDQSPAGVPYSAPAAEIREWKEVTDYGRA